MKFLRTFFSFFILCGLFFIPFPYHIVPFQKQISEFIFVRPSGLMYRFFTGGQTSLASIHSDSALMYGLLIVLMLVSGIATVFIILVDKSGSWRRRLTLFAFHGAVYYLSLHLLKYGADKLFLNQFYTPEPNTLYTPIGYVDRDLLYWSAMGTSPVYNYFMGAVEVIAALFLCFRKTRFIGLIMALGILLNVVAVNVGFNITVKLFSTFLLLIVLYTISFYRSRLLILAGMISRPYYNKEAPRIILPDPIYIFFKFLLIGLIVSEALLSFIRSGNWTGRNNQHQFLHGAYEVQQMPTNQFKAGNVKRFFVHRDSYLIFQDQLDQMQDYKLAIDRSSSVMILTDYSLKKYYIPYQWNSSDSTLTLQYNDTTVLTGKAIDWRKLPALDKRVNWISE